MIWILEWLEFNCQKRYRLWKSIVLSAQVADTSSWLLIVLGSNPNHAHLLSDFFWPPYQVSTQCLSSSKWLTRGGRRPRCVHFCAMLSQCLPKAVQWTERHCSCNEKGNGWEGLPRWPLRWSMQRRMWGSECLKWAHMPTKWLLRIDEVLDF